MKKTSTILATLVAATLACGCGDDGDDSANVDSGPDEVSVADFVGTWQASSHLYTNNADQAEQFDLIANGGETRLTVLTGGRARTWITIDDFYDEWDAQLSLDGDTLTSTPAEASRPTETWTFALAGDELMLHTEDGVFDFTMSDATPVAATVHLELTRQ